MNVRQVVRRRGVPGVLLSALLVCAAVGEVRGAQDNMLLLRQANEAFASLAETAIPGVVFISVEKTTEITSGGPFLYNDPHEFFGDEFLRRFFHGYEQNARPRRHVQRGQGSGFLVSDDGYILTNNHVAGDADRIVVKLSDGREFDAKLVGADPESEVAVIKIEGKDLPYLPLGDSAALRIGEMVVAVGNPFGLTETVTFGHVSAKGRNIGIADYEDFIQTDADINPGNSGGPLLNIEGEVIGINTAIFSQSGGSVGIGFAIPINMARSIKEQLVETGKVVRGYLGIHIQQVTTDLAKAFELNEPGGIIIVDIEKGSAAEKSELREDDVILRINGKKVESVSSFRNRISSMPPGTEMDLTVFRDKKVLVIAARTGKKEDDAASTAMGSEVYEKLGLTVESLSGELARRFDYGLSEGVIVTQVDPDGEAMQAGIRPGHLIVSVNRIRVSTPGEFKDALATVARDSDVLILRVKHGSSSRYVPLRVR